MASPNADLIVLDTLKDRGGECRYIGMKPLACPGCQGRRTTFQIIAPSKGG
jgi:hypothetical protein